MISVEVEYRKIMVLYYLHELVHRFGNPGPEEGSSPTAVYFSSIGNHRGTRDILFRISWAAGGLRGFTAVYLCVMLPTFPSLCCTRSLLLYLMGRFCQCVPDCATRVLKAIAKSHLRSLADQYNFLKL